MQKLVFINSKGVSVDLTKAPFGITEWSGFSNVDLNLQTQQVPFYDGSVYLDGLLSEREIGVTLAIDDEKDLEKRYQLRRELISILNPKLGEGTLIYTNNFISKQIKAVPQTPLFANHNSNDSGTPKANLIWTCPSPYWEDLEEKIVSFKLGEVAKIMNNGDYPCQMDVDFITTNMQNPGIVNVDTNKKIEYLGNLTENLHISTQVGQKRVVNEKLNFYFDKCYNYLLDIIYSKRLSLFVTVGDGLISYSYDLINWKNVIIDIPTSYGKIKSIAYSEEKGLFVAVGDGLNNKIFISSDGVNWSGKNLNYYSSPKIKYIDSLGIFAFIDSYKIYTSSDGENWTSTPLPNLSASLDFVYCEYLNKFIIVGMSDGSQGVIDLISSSLENPTSQTIAGERFESVGCSEDKELICIGSANGKIYTSSDGENWTSTTLSSSLIFRGGCVYVQKYEKFYMVSDNKIYTSSDGENWVENYSLNVVGYFFSSIYYCENDEILYVVGNHGKIYTSSDGENWVENYPGRLNEYSKIVYSKYCGFFVLFIDNAHYCLISYDKKIWTKKDFPGNNIYDKFIYIDELDLFALCDVNGRYIMTSKDLINWETFTTSMQIMGVTDIAYSDKLNLFVAIGTSGDYGKIYTSSDLENWVEIEININHSLKKMIYADDKFIIAVSNTNLLLISSDGVNWNSQATDSEYIVNICYSEYLKLYVISGASIFVSKDLINWNQIPNINSVNARDIIYSSEMGLFIIVGARGLIFISSNGYDWGRIFVGIYNEFLSVVYSNKTKDFSIVGEDELILTSKFYEDENVIDKLSEDSDISLGMEIGENIFRLIGIGNMNCVIKYRQKYIGV